MKKFILLLMTSVALLSCAEDKIDPYNGDSYIEFEFNRLHSHEIEISFGYESSEVVDSTITQSLVMVGKLTDNDRPYKFEQILVEENADKKIFNAVSGVNYEPFDSEDFKDLYVLKSRLGYSQLPIKLFRPAKGETYILKIQLVENSYFKVGEPQRRILQITYHSNLRKPERWENSFFGKYSSTKHQWMIDNTGEKWDDDFTKTVVETRDMYQYWQIILKNKLAEENAKREENQLEPLKDENGYMSFDPYYGN